MDFCVYNEGLVQHVLAGANDMFWNDTEIDKIKTMHAAHLRGTLNIN